MARLDPHSYADAEQPRARHLRLRLSVDFDARRIEGVSTLVFEGPASGLLDLDSKELEILGVAAGSGEAVPFEVGPDEPIFGRRVRLTLPEGTREVRLRYRTSPEAPALQWLSPEQTAGGRRPFLFSQCQPIHARSLAPLADTARNRLTYEAEVEIDEPLAAVMSAGPAGEARGTRPGTRVFRFAMPQAIPPYLLALAVGRIEARELGPRSRVFAEPETVESAAHEFAETEAMIARAEELFGPYDWDRYDMLVLPPSFPYGGMENPRMTFLTPTLLAGDRSLVDVVAHELAHSWTGNLVTNADMEHFWLNEGFTVWAERRLLEALHGEEATVLAWAIGEKALEESMERFGAGSRFTRLRTELAGTDPDDAFSSIPYEKGARFVNLLEREAGRPRFDRFMREYIARFRFTSITTEEFLVFLEERLPGLAAQVDARAWLYEPGLPGNAPSFRSARLDGLVALAQAFPRGERPARAALTGWSPAETLVYLQNLPREIDHAGCAWLDAAMGLTARGNYEILVEWLTVAAASDYEPAFPRLREVLLQVGRMKYLRPLYGAMGRHPRTRALARRVFAEASPRYHVLSRRVAASVIEKYEDPPAS
ncbi:MAG TPA: M1 family metallopeptidase [Vicinamibacteria bacterium]|nr:M1 family metallopeptidase [Vicinamibacteria bacterium]